MTALLTPPPKIWTCPNCDVSDVTPWDTPNRYHRCAGLAGILAPMVPAGSRAAVVMHEREDYIGGEDVQYDGNGRPVMAVTTERWDGSNDTVVYAPTAHGETRI